MNDQSQVNEIIVVGARGMGRELVGYLHSEGYKIKGFLDDNIQDDWKNQYPILGSPNSWEPSTNERFLVALGDARWRRHYVDLLMVKQAKFATFISNRAYIGPNVSVGEGSIVAPTAIITSDSIIGQHCILNVHTSISHDCKINDFVTFSPGSRIPGRCFLDDDVFLGTNAVLIPGVKIAKGISVGAGAVVTKSFTETNKILVGVPAKII